MCSGALNRRRARERAGSIQIRAIIDSDAKPIDELSAQPPSDQRERHANKRECQGAGAGG